MRTRLTDRFRSLLGSNSVGCEHLEPRALLAADLAFAAYYPEGFASDSVKEFVPITNTNSVEVEYELHARYEFGERDSVLARGRIAPNSRGGVTVFDTDNAEAQLVRKNTPYALVLKSSLPLAATISHYDFGTAIGESFTSQTSREWSFGEGQRDDSNRSYILVYNPDDDSKRVTLELYDDNGGIVRRELELGGQRRGGWSIGDIAELGTGRYSARIVSSGAIVAAQSQYQVDTQRGFGVIGTPDGGAVAGVIPSINYDDLFYDRNGDDPGRGWGNGRDRDDDSRGNETNPNQRPPYPRHQANAFISVLNTNAAPANVTLTFIRDDDDVARVQRTILVAPNTRSTFSIRELMPPLTSDDEFGVVYRSDVPVTMSGAIYQGMDGTGIEAATTAATEWAFGEGFMSRSRGGREVQEDIYLFNPTGREVTVTVDFMFSDGTMLSLTKRVDGLELEDVSVHKFDVLRLRAESQWYGVRVRSTAPIVASMEHWDGSIGGGFATLGIPRAGIVDLDSVLSI